MTTPAAPAASAAPTKNAQAQPAPALLPFRGGTQPTLTSDGYTATVTLGTQAQQLANYNPSPNNLLRALWLDVTCAASGNSAAVAFNGDMPLGIFSSLVFQDANEKPIVGPFDSYTLAMINKYGGYDNMGDPRASATYSATTGAGATGGSFHFVLRVPVEAVIRNGVGSLQNQSSNSTFQLQLTVTTEAAVYSTAPTAAPAVTVKIFEAGYWKGANAQYSSTPKAAGSTQYWTRGSYNALNGSQQTQLTQGLGYPIRNVVEINYATGGARSGANFPDPVQYIFKGSSFWNVSQAVWKDQMSRWFDLQSATLDAANGLDTGVFVLPFDMDFINQPGAEAGLNYLATDQGDLFQQIGTYAASSTLYHVVNYIAAVGGVQALQARAS